MRRNRTLALLVLLALSVGLAGCTGMDGGDGGNSDGNLSEAERLQQDAIAAMQDVDTYAVTRQTNASGVPAPGVASVQVSAEGTFDRAARRAHQTQTQTRTSTQGETQTSTLELYLVGNTTYRNVLGTWQSQPTPAGTWQTTTQSEPLQDAEVTIAGEETINGYETTVLQVEPDEAALQQLAQNQTATGETGGTAANITTATIRQYVATEEPHYLVRTELDMSIERDNQTTTVDQTTTFDDFGEDVSIDLPPEIQN